MTITGQFDTYRYGGVSVNSKTKTLQIGSESVRMGGDSVLLENRECNLMILFVGLAALDVSRASRKTISNIMGYDRRISSDPFQGTLVGLRKSLSELVIAQGTITGQNVEITADSLILTDKLPGKLVEGGERRSYHLNTELVQAIEKFGRFIPENELINIRLDTVITIGSKSDPELFLEHTRPLPAPDLSALIFTSPF